MIAAGSRKLTFQTAGVTLLESAASREKMVWEKDHQPQGRAQKEKKLGCVFSVTRLANKAELYRKDLDAFAGMEHNCGDGAQEVLEVAGVTAPSNDLYINLRAARDWDVRQDGGVRLGVSESPKTPIALQQVSKNY
ncbi:hypothetical protein N7462_003319 [Penicillium macrosclerotiorum]|uniref:uncharacterized protein n=1 Tax=Penicillium macrosclerotiorum TaxID=303699 RepID=UPI0025485A91|nr:uncharacterized protein N7462_003319 [Penicillium macrosclerotiorum]KAJ5688927.1 hypothetical protein N7462_003319 [Penicillium macrosclerotiorum]